MKNLLVLRSSKSGEALRKAWISVIGLTLVCLFSLNSMCQEQKTSLENFFDDPISEFNTLQGDTQFYLALYYLNKIVKQYPHQKEEILSCKALSFLKANPTIFNHISRKTLSTIDLHAQGSTSSNNKNFIIYELIFNHFKNNQVAKQLPNPETLITE